MIWLFTGAFSLFLHAEVFKPQSTAIPTYEAMDIYGVYFDCGIFDHGWTRDPNLTAGADRAIKSYLINYSSRPHRRVDTVTMYQVHQNAKSKCDELGRLDYLELLKNQKSGQTSVVVSNIDMGNNQRDGVGVYFAVFNCTVIVQTETRPRSRP